MDQEIKSVTMKKIFLSQGFSIGLAMFSMFFGAGNIIFPLVVGKTAGDKNFYASLGLILTAAMIPIAGVIAMILFKGSYKDFFGRLGKIPGFFLALFIISLLGPLGSTPRCIALSYTTFKNSFVDISFAAFSFCACTLLFILTVRRNHLLNLLGWILTPLLLCSLFAIMIIGLLTPPTPITSEEPPLALFLYGMKEGYNTMDLLAAFFFSSTILSLLRLRLGKEDLDQGMDFKTAYFASGVGAFLLSSVYIGFSYLASIQGESLKLESADQLLAGLTLKIAGPYAGILICATISLACLTTAIALISAFTDFIYKELFKKRIRYETLLFLALLLTYLVSTVGFSGISAFLSPLLQVLYPGLILLTFFNILYRLKNFQPIKGPVFLVFALSAFLFLKGMT
jgi:LIVCS family branched-chain amino acid:cation transporter